MRRLGLNKKRNLRIERLLGAHFTERLWSSKGRNGKDVPESELKELDN